MFFVFFFFTKTAICIILGELSFAYSSGLSSLFHCARSADRQLNSWQCAEPVAKGDRGPPTSRQHQLRDNRDSHSVGRLQETVNPPSNRSSVPTSLLRADSFVSSDSRSNSCDSGFGTDSATSNEGCCPAKQQANAPVRSTAVAAAADVVFESDIQRALHLAKHQRSSVVDVDHGSRVLATTCSVQSCVGGAEVARSHLAGAGSVDARSAAPNVHLSSYFQQTARSDYASIFHAVGNSSGCSSLGRPSGKSLAEVGAISSHYRTTESVQVTDCRRRLQQQQHQLHHQLQHQHQLQQQQPSKQQGNVTMADFTATGRSEQRSFCDSPAFTTGMQIQTPAGLESVWPKVASMRPPSTGTHLSAATKPGVTDSTTKNLWTRIAADGIFHGPRDGLRLTPSHGIVDQSPHRMANQRQVAYPVGLSFQQELHHRNLQRSSEPVEHQPFQQPSSSMVVRSAVAGTRLPLSVNGVQHCDPPAAQLRSFEAYCAQDFDRRKNLTSGQFDCRPQSNDGVPSSAAYAKWPVNATSTQCHSAHDGLPWNWRSEPEKCHLNPARRVV